MVSDRAFLEDMHDNQSALPGVATSGDESLETEKPWPAYYALVTAWLLPATTTRRTAHVSLPRAFAVHAIALVVTAVVITTARELRLTDPRYWPWQPFMKGFDHLLVALPLPRSGVAGLARKAVVLSAIELIFAGMSIVFLPFGARDESLWDSIRHVLRRTWLHTSHVMIIAIVLTVVGMTVTTERQWYREHADQYRRVHPPPVDAARYVQYRQSELEYFRILRSTPRPWLVTLAPLLLSLAGLFSAAWLLWALFRGITAARPMRSLNRPPLCRRCGYELTGLGPQGRCPECGLDFRPPLDHRLLPECPWNRRRKIGRVRAYVATATRMILHPAKFGAALDPRKPMRDSLLYLAASVGATVGLLVVTATAFSATITGADFGMPIQLQLAVDFTAPLALATTIGSLLLVAVPAYAIGTGDRSRTGRIRLSAAAQFTSYGSAFLPVWMAISLITVIVLLLCSGFVQSFARRIGAPVMLIYLSVWGTVNLLLLIQYISIFVRGLKGVRYAAFR